MSPEFHAAIEAHRASAKSFPNSVGARYTAAILTELDRALVLMALVPGSSQPVRDFLAIHAEAPYNRA
jgi:hypothetical protein